MNAFVFVNSATAQPESSGDVWFGISAGLSDNVLRTVVLPDSGSYTAIGVNSDFAYQSSRLAVDFIADLERRRQSIAGVPDATYGDAALSFEVYAIPDRISWLVLDRFDQGRSDPFEVSSPQNRAGFNSFSTGPRFNLPVGDQSLLRMELLEGKRSVSGLVGFDGSSREFGGAFVRVRDNITELALNLTAREFEYDSLPGVYETKGAFLSYDRALATGRAYVAFGSTRTEFQSNRSSTPFFNLFWSRNVGARSLLEIDAVQRYVDILDDDRFDNGFETVPARGAYEEQQIAVAYRIEGPRNAFSLSRSVGNIDYPTSNDFDYDQNTFAVEFSRQLTRRMLLSIAFSVFDREYSVNSQSDESARWQLTLDKDLGQRFSLRAIYQSIDDEAVIGNQVEENTVRINLRYAVARSASTSL